MIRPTLYYTTTRMTVAFTICIFWHKYVNKMGVKALFQSAFFVAAMVFLGFTWMYYLQMDGLKFHFLLEDKRSKKKKRFYHADMVDFADEKIVAMDELDDEDKMICRFVGNLSAMLIYFLLSLIGIFL